MNMLRACYDLALSPPTYDIVAALCQIEMERLRLGADAVEISFAPGPNGGFRRDALWPPTIAQREQLLWKVAVPMCRLLPRCSGIRVLDGRPPDDAALFGLNRSLYMLPRQADACAKGIRPLRPIERVARSERRVTITLREAEHWPERNSQIEQWLEAAEALASRGFDVCFIRDTAQADSGIGGFECDREAAINLHARAARYAGAFVNLGVSNGPLWMALAMDVPVLMLKPVNDQLGLTHGGAHFIAAGIPRGGQMPGAPDYQRLVWQDDTAENIVAAFDTFCADQDKKKPNAVETRREAA